MTEEPAAQTHTRWTMYRCLQLLLRFGGRLERLRVEGCPRLTDHGLRALGTCTRLQVRLCILGLQYMGPFCLS